MKITVIGFGYIGSVISAVLARNGFDFDTSKRVMDLSKEEYEKITRLF